MDTQTFDVNLCTGCVKVFVFQLSKIATVHSVSPFAAEFLYIKVMCTASNLFIRVETNTNFTVFYLRVVAQVAHSLYYFGYSSLVVSAKQGGSIGNNNVFSFMF